MDKNGEVTGVILAGGKSRRFGSDKIIAEIAGKSLIEHVHGIFGSLFKEVIIVGREPVDIEGFGARSVSDALPGLGALGGIYTGLLHATTPSIFVAACDMPLLNPACIRIVLVRAAGNDIVIPWLADGPHPLHALYSKRCLVHMERSLKEGALRIISILPNLRTLKLREVDFIAVDPDFRSFLNINTPEDHERAQRLIKDLQPP